LDSTATIFLEQWFHAHLPEPYPSETEKQALMIRTGLSLIQLNNWFGNKRIRFKRKLQQKNIEESDTSKLQTSSSTNSTNTSTVTNNNPNQIILLD